MAFSFLQILSTFPSTTSLLSLYMSFSTSLMLLRNAYNELVPKNLESFILSKFYAFFCRKNDDPSYNTFIIDDLWEGLDRNKLLDAARLYLSTKIGSHNKVIRIGKFRGQLDVTAALPKGERIVDVFDGTEITWQIGKPDDEDDGSGKNSLANRKDYYQIRFDCQYREKVYNEYLIHILSTYDTFMKADKTLKIYSWSYSCWKSMDFHHPSTLDALAMDYDLKKSIIDDLNKFMGRKEFYKRIGKAWKRGYLLYGPPGTGKSSLIAAMANYLRFNVYDLELANIHSDADLMKAMLAVDRKSITVIEDIDCYEEVHHRSKSSSDNSGDDCKNTEQFSLSSLLNGIDGLWSSCWDERILIFTTNHKEMLDPALLRPGRMDMHVNMSYCTPQGFRVLASNYLGIQDHHLLHRIDGLIPTARVTPASMAEQLLTSDDADVCLQQIVKFLEQTLTENQQVADHEKRCYVPTKSKSKWKRIVLANDHPDYSLFD